MNAAKIMSTEVQRDPTERLSEDDQATQREAEFLARAMLNQKLRAASLPAAVPGVCTNCLAQCLPLAVYCDTECREDHQVRLEIEARTGRRR